MFKMRENINNFNVKNECMYEVHLQFLTFVTSNYTFYEVMILII